jgi:hypothetical protein
MIMKKPALTGFLLYSFAYPQLRQKRPLFSLQPQCLQVHIPGALGAGISAGAGAAGGGFIMPVEPPLFIESKNI